MEFLVNKKKFCLHSVLLETNCVYHWDLKKKMCWIFFQEEHLCEKTNRDQLIENLLNYTTRDQKLHTELLKQLSCSHLVKREWFIISKVLELNSTFQSWSQSIGEKRFDWPQLAPNIWKQDFLFPFYAEDTLLYISISRVKKEHCSNSKQNINSSIIPRL